MRILIVSQYFWPENMRINDVAYGLQQRGHEVEVLTGKPNYPGGDYFTGYSLFGKSKEMHAGIKIVRIPLLARGQNSLIKLALNFACFALLGSLLAPFRVRGRFDAILVFAVSPLTQALPALVLKALGRGPVHIWLLDLWPESLSASSSVRSPVVLSLVGIMSALIHRAADLNLVCSRGFAGRLAAMGVQPSRIRHLPNFAEDVYSVAPDPHGAARCDSLLPKGFRVMFAGNVGLSQDFSTILGASELLREDRSIQWIIVGDGRALPWLEHEIVGRNLQHTVHLMGRFPLEQMPLWFQFADAMLVTLRGDPSFALTVPGKIPSYMAASKPIVAALDGEAALLIEQAGCGISVPAGNAIALAGAVLSMSKMPASELRRMGQRGRLCFEQNFARVGVITKLEQWMAAAAMSGTSDSIRASEVQP